MSPTASPVLREASPEGLTREHWRRGREQALRQIAEGKSRAAFRLVLGFRFGEAADEAGDFLREHLRQVEARIAVAMVQGLGNMVMLTPALRAIRRLYPRAEIEVVGVEPALDVLKGWDVVSRRTPLDAFDTSRERDALLVSMWGGLFKKTYLDYVENGVATLVEITYRKDRTYEPDLHLQLARVLGYEGEMPPPYCATEPAAWPFADGRPVALLADTANPEPEWRRKRWPHFPALAARLLKAGYQVGLIGGEAEARAFEAAAWPPEVVSLLGATSVPQTAWLLERADLLVANDSGPAHMAAALGTETYVLFGPTMEQKNRPLGGDNVHVLTSDIGCRPCQYLPSWAACPRNRCLERISPEQVMRAIRREPAAASGDPIPAASRPPEPAAPREAVRVDLGCGHFKRKGFLGIDVDPDSAADIVCDLREGIPLDDDAADVVAADNLLEHLGEGFRALMNEIWRVCKPTGRVEITVPLFPSQKAVADPTHRRYFTERTFEYFNARSTIWRQFGSAYGFKPFDVLAVRKLDGELEVVLRPNKSPLQPPARPQPPGEAPRLCFLSHNQPGAGGAETVMHHVANGLAAAGFPVTVLYNAAPFIHDAPVEAPADAAYEVGWVHGPTLAAFHEAAAARLAELADRVDIVLSLWRATGPGLLETCRRRGVVAGVWTHNVRYAPDRRNNSVFRAADFVVAVAPAAREMLRRRFSRSENVYVIPNAAADVFFEHYRERRPGPLRRFLFFGRLDDEQKGVLTLCEALGHLHGAGREFHLEVVGSGPDEDAMRSRVGELGLGERVRFLGRRAPEDLARRLAAADLCVLPSNFEACSLAVLEAMAVGVPLITTSSGGTPSLIKHKKQGLLIRPRRPKLLADTIAWACEHPAVMCLMARWAHKKALKRYHWERVLRDYRTLFTRLHAAALARRDGSRAREPGSPDR